MFGGPGGPPKNPFGSPFSFTGNQPQSKPQGIFGQDQDANKSSRKRPGSMYSSGNLDTFT